MGLITPVELPSLDELGAVHFVAIGGSGMNGIASMMLAHGIPVSGSDRQDSKYLRSLEAQGARVYVGHRAEHHARLDGRARVEIEQQRDDEQRQRHHP